MVLGADARDVRRFIFDKGVKPLAVGLLLGLAASFAVSRFVEHLLIGVSARDTFFFAAGVAVMAMSGIAASYVPALRASRIDPGAEKRVGSARGLGPRRTQVQYTRRFGQALTVLFFVWWAGERPGGWACGGAVLAAGCTAFPAQPGTLSQGSWKPSKLSSSIGGLPRARAVQLGAPAQGGHDD
jgi:predicted lysophospholipase L1 biosynthesis ABC-type transport system permease subunit